MNDAERAEIEALAEDICPAAVRYITSTSTTQHQCERGNHGGEMHWNDTAGVTWFGPPEPVERSA